MGTSYGNKLWEQAMGTSYASTNVWGLSLSLSLSLSEGLTDKEQPLAHRLVQPAVGVACATNDHHLCHHLRHETPPVGRAEDAAQNVGAQLPTHPLLAVLGLAAGCPVGRAQDGE
eukprot:281844-Chlamydomonas_euryale.AAC.1